MSPSIALRVAAERGGRSASTRWADRKAGAATDRIGRRTTIERAPTIDRELLDELRRELGAPAIARLAHSLRGGASILAATRLAELSEELMQRGRSGNLQGTHTLALETAAEYKRALAEMNAALGTG